MKKPSLFILGAGNIGTGLARALKKRGQIVEGIWNRRANKYSPALSQDFEVHIAPTLTGATEAIKAARIIFIAVADDAIVPLAQTLFNKVPLAPNTIVAHLSGSLNSHALQAPAHVHPGSFHPLAACPNAEIAMQCFQTSFITIEGHEKAKSNLKAVADSLGAPNGFIEAAQKARYHAAAVLASNLMVSLLAMAEDEIKACGLEKLSPALTQLALGSLERAQELGIPQSLTGPIVRGDHTTVKAHLSALSPKASSVYKELSKRATQIAQERGLDPSSTESLVKILGSS